MSSIAVFLVVAGGSALAASTLGKNTVGTKQLKNNAVTTAKIKNGAVTSAKIGAGAVGASNINTSGLTVPNATHADSATKADTATKAGSAGTADTASTANNALALGGKAASTYYGRSEILWAVASSTGVLVQGSGVVSTSQTGTGNYQITFNRDVTKCTTIGSSLDAGGGATPEGNAVRIVTTDNIEQFGEETKVNVVTTNPAGEVKNVESGDGLSVTVIC
jgi:hypothetical protein